MEILEAWTFEWRPNGKQKCSFGNLLDCKRFVENKALGLRTAAYENGKLTVSLKALSKVLTEWTKERDTLWFSETLTHPLRQALRYLERAYKKIFEGRSDFPKFKKKGEVESLRYPDPKQFKLDEHPQNLPEVRAVLHSKQRDASRVSMRGLRTHETHEPCKSDPRPKCFKSVSRPDSLPCEGSNPSSGHRNPTKQGAGKTGSENPSFERKLCRKTEGGKDVKQYIQIRQFLPSLRRKL